MIPRRAIARAVDFVTERLNGEDGLGGDLSGHGQQRDDVRSPGGSRRTSARRRWRARRSTSSWSSAMARPTASPAFRRCGTPGSPAMHCWKSATTPRPRASARGSAWLRAETGTRRQRRLVDAAAPRSPGRWAFQYANPHYPDVDDTAVVVMAMTGFAGLSRPPIRSRDRAGARVDRRAGEPQRSVGRLRCR